MSGTMVVIKEDGTETLHPWLKSKPPDWETIRDHIGGYIERCKCRYAGKVCDMWCDENGLLVGKEINPKATALIRLYYGPATQVIVGTVMVWVPGKQL